MRANMLGRTHHLMLGLVLLGLEVEVMGQRELATLADSGEDNGQVKLSPALLLDAERRLLEYCSRSVPNALVRKAS
jgi:hypothetical protein